MKLLDIISSPWAIQPEKLAEIRGIYETHLRGEKIDIKAITAKIGKPLNSQPQGYDVIDGVAVIPIDGVIAKRMNLLTHISGGISTDLLARDFKAALNDPTVRAIVLNIDSPGGTVDGTIDIANIVFQARGAKPIVAYTDGMMASAAYWIGSAADRVYIGNDATHVGSIGVVTTHVDISQAEAQAGRKTTEIYAGKYKRIASQYEPLTDEGRATIQERVDYIYSVFVSAVAAHRGISEADALAMADGKIFTGNQAVIAGLVDGVSTLDAIIADLRAGGVPGKTRKEMSMNKQETMMADAPVITMDYLKEHYKDIYDAIRALGYDEGKKAGMEEGAKAEMARIRAVRAQSLPGHEALIESLMFDGTTTGEQAAVAVLNAEKTLRAAKLDAFTADGDLRVPHSEPEDGTLAMSRRDFDRLDAIAKRNFFAAGGKLHD